MWRRSSQLHRETERRRAFDTLKNVPLFRRWSKSKVHKICQMLTFHYLRRGDRVVRQGEATDNVYFLLDGGCLISRHRVERGQNSWPTRVSEEASCCVAIREESPTVEEGHW